MQCKLGKHNAKQADPTITSTSRKNNNLYFFVSNNVYYLTDFVLQFTWTYRDVMWIYKSFHWAAELHFFPPGALLFNDSTVTCKYSVNKPHFCVFLERRNY